MDASKYTESPEIRTEKEEKAAVTGRKNVQFDSSFRGSIPKEETHGFVVVDAPNGLAQKDADVHSLDFMALHLLHIMWNGIRHNDLQEED
jgi:hypothetical protein